MAIKINWETQKECSHLLLKRKLEACFLGIITFAILIRRGFSVVSSGKLRIV